MENRNIFQILNVITVNSADAERGFSTIYNITDAKRNSLLIDTTSHLMTMNLMGKSLENFDAILHVKYCLRKVLLFYDFPLNIKF